MASLTVPLLSRTLWATGDALLWAELDLLLKDNQRAWRLHTFLVDSGTEMTTMPAVTARQLDLPMPPTPRPGLLHAQTGLEIRAGFLRAQFAGLAGTEYAIPCFFVGDPDAPTDPNQPAAQVPRSLLGLTGVVDKVRILFDGVPTPGAAYSNLIVEQV